MKSRFDRWNIGRTVLLLLLALLFCPSLSAAQCIQRRFGRMYSDEFPFLSLRRIRCVDAYRQALPSTLPIRSVFFTPGKSVSRSFHTPEFRKEMPRISALDSRWKLKNPADRRALQTGTVLDLESGYGLYHTFIGRIRHATQFQNAYYSLSGRWENTNGEERKQEDILSATMNADVDLSKRATLALDANYFQSDADLPQLDGTPHHQKSSLQLIADIQFNPSSDSFGNVSVSGEHAAFKDHHQERYEMKRLWGKLRYRQNLDLNNTFKFSSDGFFEKQTQSRDHLDTRYYSTSKLIDTFAWNNVFTAEVGLQFDSYSSAEFQPAEIWLAPLAKLQLRVLRRTRFYTAYTPRLEFPDFTQLYIRNLYTTVNPALRTERIRHDIELGIQQAFGESTTLKLGMFYQECDDVILQIDREEDKILEYFQADSVRFRGIKANLQMNVRERFAQNFSYRYMQHEDAFVQDFQGLSQHTFLPYQPKHLIQASFSWLTPIDLIIDLSGTYVSEQHRNWQKQSRIGARALLNVALTQKLTEHFQIYLLGRNLSDTDIYDIIPFLDSEEITSSRLFAGGLHLRF